MGNLGREYRDVLGAVSELISAQPTTVAIEGVVVTGSWDPASGTIEVVQGDTAAMITQSDNYGNIPLTHARIPLATTHIGDEAGPSGGERVVLLPTQGGGYVALLEHGTGPNGDTVQQVLGTGPSAGQRFFTAMRTFLFQTLGGLKVNIDDTMTAANGRITITVGSLVVIFDKQTNTLQIGGSGTTSGDAIVRQSDLQAAINALTSEFNSHKHSGVTTGGGISGTITPTYTAPTATASSTSFTA